MQNKILLVKIFLKSGNVIYISDDINNIDTRKTLEYFEKVSKRFRESSTANVGGAVGYFRYGGTSVLFNNVEAIQISDDLYNTAEIVSLGSSSNNNNDTNNNADKYYCESFVSDEIPKTNGDFSNGFFYITTYGSTDGNIV